jgi:hypothetical protein
MKKSIKYIITVNFIYTKAVFQLEYSSLFQDQQNLILFFTYFSFNLKLVFTCPYDTYNNNVKTRQFSLVHISCGTTLAIQTIVFTIRVLT